MKVNVADFLANFDQPLTNMTLLHYPPGNPNDGLAFIRTRTPMPSHYCSRML